MKAKIPTPINGQVSANIKALINNKKKHIMKFNKEPYSSKNNQVRHTARINAIIIIY
jgi:ribosomal protein L1